MLFSAFSPAVFSIPGKKREVFRILFKKTLMNHSGSGKS
jgi:hypothetical protein